MARPEDEMTLDQFLNPQDPEVLDNYGALRTTQEQVLAQHQTYRGQLQQAEAAVTERQGDLAITQRFFQILDPNVPKNARGFLYNETARALGLDPRAQNTSEVGKLLSGLDPQSSQAIRQMLVQEQERAGPGAMRKLYAGILSGQVPVSELLTRVQANAQQNAAQVQGELAQEFPRREAAMVPTSGAVEPNEMPTTGGDLPTAQPSNLPPLQRLAPPGLAKRFGLDPSEPATIGDLVNRGYTGPTDEAGINRFLHGGTDNNRGLEGRDSAFRTIVGNLAQMEDILRTGGKGIIRWGKIRVPYGGDYPIPTPPELMSGMDEVMGPNVPSSRTELPSRPGTADAEPMGEPDARTRFWSRQAAKGFGREVPADQDRFAGMSERERDAEKKRLTAQYEGFLSDTVFLLGELRGQGGKALSDQDRDFFMQQLGASPDNEARIRVLRDTFGRIYNAILSERGGVPLDISALEPEQRQVLLNSSIIPEGLRNQVIAYNNREAQQRAPAAQQQGTPPPQQTTPPTQQTPPAQQGTPPPQQQAAPPAQQTAPPQQQQTPPQQTPPARQQDGNQTQGQRQQRAQQDRAQEERAWQLQQRWIALQTFINSMSAEQRAQEGFERGTPYQRQQNAQRMLERAQDKFQAALQNVSRILGSGGGPRSSGGGGGGGGGQDSGAFRIPPKPQRTPPRIPSIRRRRGDD